MKVIVFIHKIVKKIWHVVIVIVNVENNYLNLENFNLENLLFITVENLMNIVIVKKLD